uniref:Mitochondrial potassium channel ATP-binding subunit n=1 Tax=Brachionus koreanus TaxID=1199090 RepID=A0A1J0MN01_9BILA|nr:ATP-binding cassette transporter subfamily B member 8 protein [Brachionus koreanus]
MGFLFACKIFQNSSRRSIKPYKFQQKAFFSLKNKTRLTALNSIKKKAVIGLSGLVVSSGIGYIGWNEFDKYHHIEFLKKKIKEFLDLIQNSFIVQCDSNVKQNRTAFYEETIGLDAKNKKKEPFDWIEFLKLVWNEKFYFFAATISAFLVAVLNIQIPQDLGNLINSVYDMLKSNETNYESLYKPAFNLIKLYIAQSVFTFSYIYTLGIMGENMASNLKNNLFNKIIKQDICFYDGSRSGELIDRLTTDIQEFKSSFKSCISQGLKSATQIIGCCVSLYMISPKLTLITGLIVPTAIAFGSFFGSILRKYSRKAQAQISKSTAVADEAINNVRTVRAFAMEDNEVEIFANEVEKARKLNIKLSLGIGIFQGVSNLFVNGMVLGVLYAGGQMLINNEINAGQMMAYLTATQMIQRSFTQLSILFGQALRGISSGARVFEFLSLQPSIPVDDVGAKIRNLKGNIEFKNVSFKYPNREEMNVLENFNLEIKPGEIVAIVGHSGSGKSTVCSLLERFYDINDGNISIDGVDINELSPYWLRRQAIGYISQEPILFATSISENIRYGKPDATDDEVIQAAKLANAHDFISSFPKQYDTVIGERGTTLSGGQKQRIAITRALLKNPKILILDEATSALDSKSERLVQETINNVIKGHTVIIVAHRLSTIQKADKIVVMHNGKIIEIGNHKQLMESKGHYYNLFNLQSLK